MIEHLLRASLPGDLLAAADFSHGWHRRGFRPFDASNATVALNATMGYRSSHIFAS